MSSTTAQNDRQRGMIAITGAGIISALGIGVEATLQALRQGKSGIGEMTILGSRHNDLPVGEVRLTNDELKAMLGINPSETISRTTLLAMTAVDEAINNAGIGKTDASAPSSLAFISATTVGGMDITEQQWAEVGDDWLQQHFACCHTDAVNARLGGMFSQTLTISTACSAAANAIVSGAMMIERGDAQIVVAGGSEALSRYHFNGFNSLMILDCQPCRPFDRDRHGLNLGEGAAYVCLETVEHAKARGAKILAVLKGWGNKCDAYHQTATSPEGNGPYLAMDEALRRAELTPEDIQYVNAHGTGTDNNDSSETEALKRLFGDNVPPFSSTKAFTGHTTSASGSIEAVICLLALQHQFMPANLNFKQPFDGGLTPVTTAQNTEVNNILSNSFAFGGNDTSLILSRYNSEEKGKITKFKEDKNEVCETTADFSGIEIFDEVPPIEDIDAKSFVSAMKLRRLDPLLKEVLLKSLYILRTNNIETLGAIFCNTVFGCMGPTEKFLKEMLEQQEQAMSPTAFMLSTHNTIATLVARETGCHGYNITFSHPGAEQEAEKQAATLIGKGEIDSALIITADRLPEEWKEKMGEETCRKFGNDKVEVKLMKR